MKFLLVLFNLFFCNSFKLWNNCSFGIEMTKNEFYNMSKDELYKLVVYHQVLNIKNIQIIPTELERISLFFGKYGHVNKKFPIVKSTNYISDIVKEKGQRAPGSTWHVDLGYLNISATMTLLYGLNMPTEGNTNFISTYDKYKSLSKSEKKFYSSIIINQTTESKSTFSFKPVIIKHPVSKKKCIYVQGIERMNNVLNYTIHESKILFNYLLQNTIKNMCSYKWSDNDLLIFDNRCLVHRAAATKETDYRRLYRIFMYD